MVSSLRRSSTRRSAGTARRDHVDRFDALAILGNRIAREHCLHGLRHILWRETQCAGTVLIDLEADRLLLLAPVEMGVDDLGVGRHDLANLLGDLPHFQRIGLNHTELHREADWWTKEEAIYSRTRRRHRAIGDGLIKPLLHPLARFEVFGDN